VRVVVCRLSRYYRPFGGCSRVGDEKGRRWLTDKLHQVLRVIVLNATAKLGGDTVSDQGLGWATARQPRAPDIRPQGTAIKALFFICKVISMQRRLVPEPYVSQHVAAHSADVDVDAGATKPPLLQAQPVVLAKPISHEHTKHNNKQAQAENVDPRATEGGARPAM
jgi:hypothetical protein